MIVGVEPCLYFSFVVDYFASEFVVEEDVVVVEVLEGSTVEREAFGEFFVVNEGLTIERGDERFWQYYQSSRLNHGHRQRMNRLKDDVWC